MDTKNDETIIHLVQDLVRMKSDNPGEEESVVQLHLRDLLKNTGQNGSGGTAGRHCLPGVKAEDLEADVLAVRRRHAGQ